MKNKIAVFVATWFYSGFIPPILLNGMAGTYGSFFSIPLCYFAIKLAQTATGFSYWGIMLLIFLLGLWSVPKAEAVLGPKTDWKGKTKIHDQNQIVIDEVLGMLVACYPLTIIGANHLFTGLGTAFVIFRFFDIVKIPPINFLDRIENAAGVMLDDFMAGIYAALVLLIVLLTAGL